MSPPQQGEAVAAGAGPKEPLCPFPPFEEFLRAHKFNYLSAGRGVWEHTPGFTLAQGQRIDLWLHLAALYGAALEIVPPQKTGKRQRSVCPVTGLPDPSGRAHTVLWQLPDGGYCRIAEDGSLASVPGDTHIPNTPGLRITPVHPWDMTAELLAAWGPISADYRMLLPPWQAVETAEVRAIDFCGAVKGAGGGAAPHKLGWAHTDLPPSFDREGWQEVPLSTRRHYRIGVSSAPWEVYAWPSADTPNVFGLQFGSEFRRVRRGKCERSRMYGIHPVQLPGSSSPLVFSPTAPGTRFMDLPCLPGAQIVRQVSGGHAVPLALALLIVRTQRLCAESAGESMADALVGHARTALRRLYVWHQYATLEARYLALQSEQQQAPPGAE